MRKYARRSYRVVGVAGDVNGELVCGSCELAQVRAMSGCWAWSGHGSVADMTTSPNPYRGFRFPAEVIQHAVWLDHCFSLSLRDVKAILAARGVVVSYESIREWGLRFGPLFANTLKRRRPRPGETERARSDCDIPTKRSDQSVLVQSCLYRARHKPVSRTYPL